VERQPCGLQSSSCLSCVVTNRGTVKLLYLPVLSHVFSLKFMGPTRGRVALAAHFGCATKENCADQENPKHVPESRPLLCDVVDVPDDNPCAEDEPGDCNRDACDDRERYQ